jgi:L-ascorbate metabolism protein UlaG (beta-lactamase superfamily)
MKITWYGHAAFELEGKLKTLIDPYITNNPAATVRWQDLKPDVIAVTHGHGDHLGDTMEIAAATGCAIVAVAETAEYLIKKGLKVIDLDFGGSFTIEGVEYALVPAVHSNSIEAGNALIEAGDPAGVIVSDGKIVYHAGDTALFGDMSLIRELYTPDIALLPIGGRYTMDAKAALLAVKLIRPKVVIPMHYNTRDKIKADEKAFKKAVEHVTDAEVILMRPGDSIVL